MKLERKVGEHAQAESANVLEDLFFLARTDDVFFDGSTWAETGRFKGCVNNSCGFYFDRKSVGRVLEAVNGAGVTPESLVQHLEATMAPETAAHWREKLLPSGGTDGQPTGLRQVNRGYTAEEDAAWEAHLKRALWQETEAPGAYEASQGDALEMERGRWEERFCRVYNVAEASQEILARDGGKFLFCLYQRYEQVVEALRTALGLFDGAQMTGTPEQVAQALAAGREAFDKAVYRWEGDNAPLKALEDLLLLLEAPGGATEGRRQLEIGFGHEVVAMAESRIKTLDAWHRSRLPMSSQLGQPGFLRDGDLVDEALVTCMAGQVPPLTLRPDLVQVGEPSCSDGQGRSLYATFTRHPKTFCWTYEGNRRPGNPKPTDGIPL